MAGVNGLRIQTSRSRIHGSGSRIYLDGTLLQVNGSRTYAGGSLLQVTGLRIHVTGLLLHGNGPCTYVSTVPPHAPSPWLQVTGLRTQIAGSLPQVTGSRIYVTGPRICVTGLLLYVTGSLTVNAHPKPSKSDRLIGGKGLQGRRLGPRIRKVVRATPGIRRPHTPAVAACLPCSVTLSHCLPGAPTHRASRGMMLPTSWFKFLRIQVIGNTLTYVAGSRPQVNGSFTWGTGSVPQVAGP